MFEHIKNTLFLKDPNNSLGFLRLSCGILGSLCIAYLCIMLIAQSLNFSVFENVVIGVILLPLFWSIFALWIILSSTKFYAILKTFLPLTLLYILTYIILG